MYISSSVNRLELVALSYESPSPFRMSWMSAGDGESTNKCLIIFSSFGLQSKQVDRHATESPRLLMVRDYSPFPKIMDCRTT
jgi:hypothetical protein